LSEGGSTKDDLNLPTFVKVGEPTDEDKRCTEDILDGLDKGETVIVIVQAACGEEKVVTVKMAQK